MYFIPIVIAVGILAWILKPRKDLSKAGKNAILLITISSLILAVVSVIVQLVQNSTGVPDLSNISNTLFIIGIVIIFLVIILTVFFAVRHQSEIVRALSFGACIGVIICVVELFILGWLAGDF